MKKQVYAACPHDCPDACGVLITVDDGKAVKIQGDSRHPMTRGFLCAKVAKYLDRVYSPDRLRYLKAHPNATVLASSDKATPPLYTYLLATASTLSFFWGRIFEPGIAHRCRSFGQLLRV